MKRLLQTRNTLSVNAARVSRKNFREKEHIIVSGVSHMIGDAVMNGINYPLDEVVTLANAQSNKRVVMPASHPVGDEGEFISASDPLALMSNFVGAFAFNFSVQGDKLISDIAINPEIAKASAQGEQIVNAIEAGEAIDVSTGFYLNVDDSVGFGNDGEPFTGTASNLFLDHVAFLPNEVGAKNKSEGVGLFANSATDKDGDKMDTDVVKIINASSPALQLPLAPGDHAFNAVAALERVKTFTNSTEKPSSNYRKFFLNFDQSSVDDFASYTNLFADIIDGVPHAVKSAVSNVDDATAKAYLNRFDSEQVTTNDGILKGAWNKLKSIFINESSHGDISEKIWKKINENKTDADRHAWPMEVFTSHFIYQDTNDTMYKQSYLMDGDELTLVGDRVEVQRVTEFKPVTNHSQGDTMNKEELIAMLAANGVAVQANISDDALKALVANQLKPAEVKDFSAQITSAVNAAIKPLQDKLNANSDKELSDSVAAVVALDMGIDEATAKAMGATACNAFIAKNGKPAFNSHGRQQQNSADNGLDNVLPE